MVSEIYEQISGSLIFELIYWQWSHTEDLNPLLHSLLFEVFNLARHVMQVGL